MIYTCVIMTKPNVVFSCLCYQNKSIFRPRRKNLLARAAAKTRRLTRRRRRRKRKRPPRRRRRKRRKQRRYIKLISVHIRRCAFISTFGSFWFTFYLGFFITSSKPAEHPLLLGALVSIEILNWISLNWCFRPKPRQRLIPSSQSQPLIQTRSLMYQSK